MPAGPVNNLTHALEAAGIVMVHSDMAGSAVDGVTFSAPRLRPLLVLKINQPADRMRFTMAHELGHLVLHRTQPTQQMEDQANEFARKASIKDAFLMSIRQLLSLTMMRMSTLRPFQAAFDIGDGSAQQLRRLAQRDQSLGERPIAKPLEALRSFHGTASAHRLQFIALLAEPGARRLQPDRGAHATGRSSAMNDFPISG